MENFRIIFSLSLPNHIGIRVTQGIVRAISRAQFVLFMLFLNFLVNMSYDILFYARARTHLVIILACYSRLSYCVALLYPPFLSFFWKKLPWALVYSSSFFWCWPSVDSFGNYGICEFSTGIIYLWICASVTPMATFLFPPKIKPRKRKGKGKRNIFMAMCEHVIFIRNIMLGWSSTSAPNQMCHDQCKSVSGQMVWMRNLFCRTQSEHKGCTWFGGLLAPRGDIDEMVLL